MLSGVVVMYSNPLSINSRASFSLFATLHVNSSEVAKNSADSMFM